MEAKDFENKFDGFDEYCEACMKDWQVPGLAISIVNDGEIIDKRAYGYRDHEKKLEMNFDTLYRLASHTKAFTAASVALLVDEGKLEWDAPVAKYLPYFKMKDQHATDNISVRDILCHRSGLPSHNWALHDFKSRKEVVENLKYLDMSYPVRTKFQYSNAMYIVAAHLVDYLSGQSWESFVKEKLLEPLGMDNTNFSFAESKSTQNFSEFYYLSNGKREKYDWENDFHYLKSFCLCIKDDSGAHDPFIPTIGMNSSTNDLAKWLIFQLNMGSYNNKRIISKETFKEMHIPQMIYNMNIRYDEFGDTYAGLGWYGLYYRGEKIIFHGGHYGSQLFFVPKHNIGFVYMANVNCEMKNIIPFNILDRLLGLEPVDWRGIKLRKKEEDERAKNISKTNEITEETKPSHDLKAYCGVFTNEAYGKFHIETDGEKLFMVDENKYMELRHCNYDTFELLSNNKQFLYKITFQTNTNGLIDLLVSRLDWNVKEIQFLRVSD